MFESRVKRGRACSRRVHDADDLLLERRPFEPDPQRQPSENHERYDNFTLASGGDCRVIEPLHQPLRLAIYRTDQSCDKPHLEHHSDLERQRTAPTPRRTAALSLPTTASVLWRPGAEIGHPRAKARQHTPHESNGQYDQSAKQCDEKAVLTLSRWASVVIFETSLLRLGQ